VTGELLQYSSMFAEGVRNPLLVVSEVSSSRILTSPWDRGVGGHAASGGLSFATDLS
jgi:hypothetical protein